MLFAAGALVVERFVRRRRWGWLKPAYAAILLVSGVVFAPLAAPLLPAETLANITGGGAGIKQERREVGQLPQHFADRFGWENMAETVAGVYRSLRRKRGPEAASLPAASWSSWLCVIE